jgi:hypothetical protein
LLPYTPIGLVMAVLDLFFWPGGLGLLVLLAFP